MYKIKKIDAARRQLDVAIRLWLQEDDLAAVQTLAYAALTIIRDLTKAAGRPAPYSPTHDLDRAAANFLKHANRDPDAWMLEIDAVVPEIAFHEALGLYADLGAELTPEMKVAAILIDHKYGLGEHSDAGDRRREEDRERERTIEKIDGAEDRQKAQHELQSDRRSRQAGLLIFGRELLEREKAQRSVKHIRSTEGLS